jgi:Fe-S cluster biogenesis protein NfuA|tara:strand:+ start:2410 stop:2691 length:282 start_codon:yes stop_codon:yes gene_type:complete
MIKPEVVNKSLDDIRPYIEADGGYLEFVEIEYNLDEVVRDYYGVKDGEEAAIVKVRLHGACTSCVMSAQTLKMGIEKHLVMTFPEIVGVIQVE